MPAKKKRIITQWIIALGMLFLLVLSSPSFRPITNNAALESPRICPYTQEPYLVLYMPSYVPLIGFLVFLAGIVAVISLLTMIAMAVINTPVNNRQHIV